MNGVLEGGYDYQFIDPGPSNDQKCPICCLVVRDAYQVNCCGKLFCKICLTNQKKIANKCPMCRANIDDKYFMDTKSNREIRGLRILCGYNGCNWIGELGNSEKHMEACEFSEVKCQECEEIVLKAQIDDHLSLSCPMRMYECKLCGELGAYQFILNGHHEFCPNIELICFNDGCSVCVKRCEMASHQETCPKKVVPCVFRDFGCEFECKRENHYKHLEKDMSNHIVLISQRVQTQNEALLSIDQWLKHHHARILPVTIKFAKFKEFKSKDQGWFSDPCYTHHGGFRIRIGVYPNGKGQAKSKHVSVYINLMPGINDDSLSFPFEAKFTVELLNQLKDSNHYSSECTFNDSSPVASIRKYNDDIFGLGITSFIPINSLGINSKRTTQYLKDDCLYFRLKVRVSSQTKAWLAVTV